jgi:plasmid stability protein
MDTRNITLSLPRDLIRQAKIHAAELDMTVNAFVRELLQEALSRESRNRDAAARLLALAEQGLCFNADLRSIRREDIYERR